MCGETERYGQKNTRITMSSSRIDLLKNDTPARIIDLLA